MTALQQTFLALAALFGLLGVAGGAFGAHLLKSKLSVEMLNVYEVAVRYQLIHALALIALVALLGTISSPWITIAGIGFILGTLIFSGSLYLLVLSGVRFWGAVTPVGGILLILGWLSLLLAAFFRTS